MINELLNNPAYLRLLKNATSLTASEVVNTPADIIPNVPATLPMIISAPKTVSATPINTAAAVIKSTTTKDTSGGDLILIIGLTIIVGIAAYNFYLHYNPNDKTKNNYL